MVAYPSSSSRHEHKPSRRYTQVVQPSSHSHSRTYSHHSTYADADTAAATRRTSLSGDERGGAESASSTVTSSRSTHTKASSSSSATSSGDRRPRFVSVPNMNPKATNARTSIGSGSNANIQAHGNAHSHMNVHSNGTAPDDIRSSSDSVSSRTSRRSAERAPASPPADHDDIVAAKANADTLEQIQENPAYYSSARSAENRTASPSVSLPRMNSRVTPVSVKRHSAGLPSGSGSGSGLTSPANLDAREQEISALKDQLLRMEAELLRKKIAKAEQALKGEQHQPSSALSPRSSTGSSHQVNELSVLDV